MSKKITELDLSSTVSDDDLLINQTSTSTKAVKFSVIKNLISGISDSKIGILANLTTSIKDTIVNAINSLKSDVDDISSTVSSNSTNINDLISDVDNLSTTVSGIHTDIATTSSVGTVKPDGTTITIDVDGTIHGSGSSEVPDGVTYVDGTDSEITGGQPQVLADSVNGIKFSNIDGILKPYTNSSNILEGIELSGGVIKGTSDSLVSTDTTIALSSNGAKLLKDAIDVNSADIETNSNDINNIETSIGTTDISAIGDGSCKGAISAMSNSINTINSNLSPATFIAPASYWGGNGETIEGGYIQIGKLVIINIKLKKFTPNWYTATVPIPLLHSVAMKCTDSEYNEWPCIVLKHDNVGIIIIKRSTILEEANVSGVYIAA